jgi:hypothetical protein
MRLGINGAKHAKNKLKVKNIIDHGKASDILRSSFNAIASIFAGEARRVVRDVA